MSEGVEATAVSSSSVGSPTTTTTTTTTTTGTFTTSGTTLDSHDVTESSPPPPPPPLPPPPDTPTKTATNLRKYKKHVFNHNRYNLYDGKKIRSALIHKKWPPKSRKVSFPTSDNDLVTSYLEPANPWEHAENVNIEDLISSYKKSCEQHCTEPLQNIVSQLEKLDISEDERCAELCMKNESLNQKNCEPLEEILKRVQFEKIDLEAASLDDESAVILFDMTEYYQSARHLNMSNNRNIGSRGWQACAHMIKKTTCLEQLEARDITLTQQHMHILKRPLQLVSHLHILKLENCGLAGRAFAILVSALKLNTGLKELYLADNDLEKEDAIQLGALLRINNHLQLLDISNNHIQDEGVRDLLDGLNTQSNDDRQGRGLGILVLWNNDLTKSSSAYFAQTIAQSVTLETLNIGKNAVCNELLEWSEEALVKSNTLLQLGMQSTNVTCRGALVLAEILEKNRTLQRIDLRDNNIQMEGLAALSFAMKRNTSVTQMDLDDKPWSTTPATMHQYLDLVAEIRGYCVRNDESTSSDDSTEESSSPQHRSRLSSVSSRKISLTCQTLPRSPPSMTPTTNEIANRAMLEPKRTSGRLRSPAPSPIPSPVASPIPSPSRGRFVVSRVSEASLSSTNSSASSSPVTPPSLGSSPTCFFPTSSGGGGGGSSRFRVVTVAEPAVPAAKSVVTSTNANVTIGFNYRVQTPEGNDSDDSDSVFRSDVEEDYRATGNESSASIDIDVSLDEETRRVCSVKAVGSTELLENNKEDEEAAKTTKEETTRFEENQPINEVNEKVRSENIADDTAKVAEATDKESTEFQASEIEETKSDRLDSRVVIEAEVHAEKRTEESLRDEIIVSFQSEPKKPEPVQRQATSLEKLLGLFQHPGSIFSGGSFERTETKNPLQDGVNSMIALGDKFQQYLREGRGSSKSGSEDSPSHAPLQRSVSDASRSTIKLDPVKSLSIPQLSSIQATCTRDFASYKEGSRVSADNLSGNDAVETRAESTNSSPRRIFVVKENTADNLARSEESVEVPRISEDLPLPESAQSIAEIDKDGESRVSPIVATDNANNAASSIVGDTKTTMCAPKLKDIPEYSVLEIRETRVETVTRDESSSRNNVENKRNRENDDEETICDSSTTDSINDPSFKNSSHCKVTCDISGVVNVHTLGIMDDVHNFFNAPTSHDCDSERVAASEQRDLISFASVDDNDPVVETKITDGDDIENIKNSQKNHEDADANANATRNRDAESRIANSSKDVQAIVANNVDLSLPVLNNLCVNHSNDTKVIDARGNPAVGRDVDYTSIDREGIEFSDTVEEFLPIDVVPAAAVEFVEPIVPLRELVTPLANNCANDCFNLGDSVTINRQQLDLIGGADRKENNESRATNDESAAIILTENIPIADRSLVKETVTITDRVALPIANSLSNDFSSNKNEISSVDYDEIAASIDQISTSISEDSDYSSKLSIDDVRICDSTANSPGNDRIGEIVGAGSVTIGNETSQTTEHRCFVRVAVETVLTSILGVTESARATSSEIKNSESADDLMFKMTDISTDVSPNVGEMTTSSIVTTIEECGDSASLVDAFFDPGQSSRSPTNLFIDKSRKVHRNSQDSGIEETTVSISEDSVIEGNGQPRESFQESVDSGIDSECSSVCARVDVGADVQKERARDPGKATNADLTIDDDIRSFSASQTNKEILTVEEISRIVNDTAYKNVIEDKKSSVKLMEVIGVGRSVETTDDRTNVAVRSTSPE